MTTFKSERAAKMANTKATRVYEAAKSLANVRQAWDAEREIWMPLEWGLLEERRALATKAFEHMAELYGAAKAQGYFVSNWYLGHNPTRDLVAMNID